MDMGTVQLQCGHCQKVMAISEEHLGGLVHCPHCKGVVQTQKPSVPEAAPVLETPAPSEPEHPLDSIFAPPEASDEVVGQSPAPKVEMPAPGPGSAPTPDSSGTSSDLFLPSPAATNTEPASPSSESDLPKFTPRPVYDSGVLTMYAFIFLIPYAILATLAVLYLLFFQGPRTHPLDLMKDDAPKGRAKQITRVDRKHPLADHQKTTLGKEIRVGKDGDLTVTFVKVVLTKQDDLALHLRARNNSKNAEFSPVHESFVRKMWGTTFLPYTYLEATSHAVGDIHDFYLMSGDKILKPKEEVEIQLVTDDAYRRKIAEKVAGAKDSYVWRVHLRRGLYRWQNEDHSTTAVIAVEFNSEQIQREG